MGQEVDTNKRALNMIGPDMPSIQQGTYTKLDHLHQNYDMQHEWSLAYWLCPGTAEDSSYTTES